MSDPDDAITEALDTELLRLGIIVEPHEVEDVVEAVTSLPPAAFTLLCERWRARNEPRP